MGADREGASAPRFADVAAFLIAGPTASGKSALAAALARRIGAEVVNADAMQVYRELAVLTARPGPAEFAAAPHRLYGHVPAAADYSVAAWLGEVEALLADAQAARRPVVIAGGTGLYFHALVTGLSPVPPVPPQVRARWRERAALMPAAALYDALAARDPAMAARLRPSDPQRIVRALEVVEATGVSLADWQARPGPPLLAPPGVGLVRGLVIAPDRAGLHAAIERRFDAMLAGGALGEAERLGALGLPADRPALKALGVAPLAEHLSGRICLDEARQRAIVDTRRYARRQETFFRSRLGDWPRIGPPEDVAAAADRLSREGLP